MNQLPKTFSQPNLFAGGMGNVVIVRYKSGGRVEAGVFLLDTYCLGVKNAFFHQCHEDAFPDSLERIFKDVDGGLPEEHSGAWGRKLVEEAAAYAQALGFAPHRHYKQAARVFGGIDPKDCAETFVFGSDGKPLFIAGPNDGKAKCNLILRVLTKKLGPQGFHFMVPQDGMEAFFADGEADDDEEEEEEDK
ncbi:MAG: hypothetical protein NTW21_38340 [Verrucomicrobia bacterium]|nr:hypothetical protein [Verrucomicrobiota bacterium]